MTFYHIFKPEDIVSMTPVLTFNMKSLDPPCYKDFKINNFYSWNVSTEVVVFGMYKNLKTF